MIITGQIFAQPAPLILPWSAFHWAGASQRTFRRHQTVLVTSIWVSGGLGFLSLTGWVALGKLSNLSEPCFLHL